MQLGYKYLKVWNFNFVDYVSSMRKKDFEWIRFFFKFIFFMIY